MTEDACSVTTLVKTCSYGSYPVFPEADYRTSAGDPLTTNTIHQPRAEKVIVIGDNSLHKIPAGLSAKSVEIHEKVDALVMICNLKECR